MEEAGAGASSASAYRAAGVDLDQARSAVERIRTLARSTFTPRVESEIGVFAGFFAFPEVGSSRLLVASMDGVGTKVMLAAHAGRWRGVGWDLVAHGVDDILTHGARPLFFLDYIGMGKLSAEVLAEVLEGMAEACRLSGCALLGGETAEMPGMYRPGELDLVGTIVGEVAREDLVDGRRIEAGDLILALPSDGLHTNGYSLARRVLDSDAAPEVLHERVPGEEATWEDALLRRHRMYLPPVRPLLGKGLILGMAHITGGGITENLPRMLPQGCRAVIDRGAWSPPPLFRALRELGSVGWDEAYRVLNMGVGFLLVVRAGEAEGVLAALRQEGEPAFLAGRIETGDRSVRYEGSPQGSP